MKKQILFNAAYYAKKAAEAASAAITPHCVDCGRAAINSAVYYAQLAASAAAETGVSSDEREPTCE